MFGDNVEMIGDFVYDIVFEFGLCFILWEGGKIIGIGIVLEIYE